MTAVYYRDRLPLTVSSNSQTLPLWSKQAEESFTRITSAQLKTSLENREDVVVLDLRSRAEYATGHIPDAKNIPLDELEARVFDELQPSTRIVLYCECPTEASSNMGYRILAEVGYKPAVLVGGLESWKAHGFSTSTSSKPIEW